MPWLPVQGIISSHFADFSKGARCSQSITSLKRRLLKSKLRWRHTPGTWGELTGLINNGLTTEWIIHVSSHGRFYFYLFEVSFINALVIWEWKKGAHVTAKKLFADCAYPPWRTPGRVLSPWEADNVLLTGSPRGNTIPALTFNMLVFPLATEFSSLVEKFKWSRFEIMLLFNFVVRPRFLGDE